MPVREGLSAPLRPQHDRHSPAHQASPASSSAHPLGARDHHLQRGGVRPTIAGRGCLRLQDGACSDGPHLGVVRAIPVAAEPPRHARAAHGLNFGPRDGVQILEADDADGPQTLDRQGSDAPSLRQGQVGAQVRLLVWADHSQAIGFGGPGGELGHQLGPANPHGDRQAQICGSPPSNLTGCRVGRVRVRGSDVEERFLHGPRLHGVRELAKKIHQGIAGVLYLGQRHINQGQLGAQLLGLPDKHGGMDTATASRIISAGHKDVGYCSHGHGGEFGPPSDNHGRGKSIGVGMKEQRSGHPLMLASGTDKPARPWPCRGHGKFAA